MVQNITKIKWNDFTELFPAFLAMVGIPFSFSIADGLALGFICYPLLKLLSSRHREAPIIMYILSAVFIIYFAAFRS